MTHLVLHFSDHQLELVDLPHCPLQSIYIGVVQFNLKR